MGAARTSRWSSSDASAVPLSQLGAEMATVRPAATVDRETATVLLRASAAGYLARTVIVTGPNLWPLQLAVTWWRPTARRLESFTRLEKSPSRSAVVDPIRA